MRDLERIFVAGPNEIAMVEVSVGVNAAYDILTDAGVSPEKAAELAVGAERLGRDPEHFARHFLSLRKAVQ